MKVYLNLQTGALILYYIAFSNLHLFSKTFYLKFLSKIASLLAISLNNVQDSAPYVATGHILI